MGVVFGGALGAGAFVAAALLAALLVAGELLAGVFAAAVFVAGLLATAVLAVAGAAGDAFAPGVLPCGFWAAPCAEAWSPCTGAACAFWVTGGTLWMAAL